MRTILKTKLKMRIKINRITKERTHDSTSGSLTDCSSLVDGIVGYVLSLEEMAKGGDLAVLPRVLLRSITQLTPRLSSHTQK